MPHPKDVQGEVVSNASRALELDSTLALSRVALGVAYEHSREWRRAEAEFQRALRLEPNHTEALIQYGRFERLGLPATMATVPSGARAR